MYEFLAVASKEITTSAPSTNAFLTNTFLAQVIAGIIIAFAASLFTVWFALKRFRTERWWDRKADAYSSILEALHYAKQGTLECLDKRMDQLSNQLREKMKAAWNEIHKAINTGSFLLCRDARKALDALTEATNKTMTPTGNNFDFNAALKVQLKAVNRCLEVLPLIAKKDLSVK